MKPKIIIAVAGPKPVLRCFDIESGYTYCVQQDLIAKALEGQS